MKQLNHEIIKKVKTYDISEPEYIKIGVNDTEFVCQTEEFNEYIINCPEDHWNKVEQWIDEKLIPYMTRKSINYNTHSSYGLKHVCENEIGDYVANVQIMYILALKNVPCGASRLTYYYGLNLHYPLSMDFERVRRETLYRPKFKIRHSH